ncbi:MAG: hypothetical protein ABIF71_08910 [Planctomycetota bacterium]
MLLIHPTMAPLLRVKHRSFVNRVAAFYRQSPFQFFLLLTMGVFLALVMFGFFYGGFRFIRRFEDLEDVMVRYIFALFFFAIFLMLLFSGTIITYSTLYYGTETTYLLTHPVPYHVLFFVSFIDSVLFSSWAFMFLAVPVLAAYGLAFHVPVLFYPLTILALLPFLAIPAAMAGLVTLLVGLLPRRRVKLVFTVLGILLVAPVVWAALRLFLAERALGVMQALWVEEVFRSLDFARSAFLPSLWAAEIVTSFKVHMWGNIALHFMMLLANALLLTLVVHWVAGGLLIRGWNVVRNFGSTRRFRGPGIAGYLVRLIPFMGRPVRLILLKDIRSFLRDPGQWLQFMIFFGLIGLYFINLRSFGYDDAGLRWKNIISFLNLSAVSMTLATLNGRFVFPQVSLEGRKFWIIGMMPVTRTEIIRGKFYFAFLSGGFISVLLILLSDGMLKVSANIMLVHLYTVSLVAFGLAGIAVGAGALWPNFKETSPSKIVSGIGGTLNLIISIFFVILMIFVVTIPLHYYYAADNGHLATVPLTVILAIATVFAIGSGTLFLWLGAQRFRRMEVF